MKKFLFLTVCLIVAILSVSSQSREIEELWHNQFDSSKIEVFKPEYLAISNEEIIRLFDKQPSFGMYHDNYLTTGVPTDKAITKDNADAKFQISIRQRLTKTILPFNTFLMVTYTQKSFWNVYAKSAPFTDNNYNPGLTLAKPIAYRNSLRGMASLAIEHESNGRDSTASRSWNYFVLTGAYYFNVYFSAQVKLWAGWLDDANSDLLYYRGYGLFALNYRMYKDVLWASLVLNPCKDFHAINTQLEVNLKLSKKSNQYLFIQWYNGYGENLLEYNQYTSMLRAGICIKPALRNIY
jgi:phospholipase A1